MFDLKDNRTCSGYYFVLKQLFTYKWNRSIPIHLISITLQQDIKGLVSPDHIVESLIKIEQKKKYLEQLNHKIKFEDQFTRFVIDYTKSSSYKSSLKELLVNTKLFQSAL